tara:strand:+ start:8254 stop:11739 length:3486 start_codon:yes stop_codon:yes gene_type:complete
MSKRKTLSSQRQPNKLFKPKRRTTARRESSDYLSRTKDKNISFKDFKDTNIFSTASHRYNDKEAIVSTQEINTDYSNFINHTFFHSAVAKVNESFDLILNKFPYDGTNKEIESFEDNLTGYEKHVYDIYPKNIGYLILSGTKKIESQTNGTYINVKDIAGAEYKSIATNKKGNSVINPGNLPLNIQFFINFPKQPNDNQTVMQKYQSLAYNFGIYLSESNSSENCEINFLINSGSRSIKASATLPKGEFVHVTAEYQDCNQFNSLMLMSDSIVDHTYATSSNKVFFEKLSPIGALSIGRGSNIRDNKNIFTLQESLTGSLDEFRIFHKAISKKDIKKHMYRSVSGHENLALYFKFNEPFGTYAGNNIVLDASGKSLNSTISNYLDSYTRNTGSHAAQPVKMEKISDSPILFPEYTAVKTLNTSLLANATDYDDVNPNLITKLIPPHYLELGNEQDNFQKTLGGIAESFDEKSSIQSNQNTKTSVQLLVKLLLSWAKIFDEIKIYIDHFSKINFVEYDEYETVSNKFLSRLGGHLGINLPKLFSNASVDQLISGYELNNNPELAIRSLQDLQNIIWRRILSDVANIKQTKGHLDAIRSVFRSSGIEAENIFNFREYGGSQAKDLKTSVEIKKDIINFLNFSGSISNLNIATLNNEGRSSSSPFLKSGYLSSSRKEKGKPEIRGVYTNGESNNSSDGLFTTSSFTIQGYYTFDKRLRHPLSQSLFRINATGSDASANKEATIINIVANESSINAHISDGVSNNSISTIKLENVNILDGDIWAINFSKNNGINSKNVYSDEYFLRAAKYIAGNQQEYIYTSSFIAKKSDSVFSNWTTQYNVSGTFLTIGSQSLGASGKFINSTSDKKYKATIFSGETSYLNFWSSFKEENEFLSYAKNPNSVGTNQPSVNYNFALNEPGSFERLRLQTFGKQATTSSKADGTIRFFDFSQNNLHLEAENFEPSKVVMTPNYHIYEILSENFDINSSKDKIRIRSIQNSELLKDNNFALIAPAYETPLLEESVDDTRFSIDMSAMKGLNENILTIFPDFQPMENSLGQANALFANEYRDLRVYSDIYFNNVIEDLDLGRYRSIFKWIDSAYSDLVYSLIPRTTTFMGINFIYESHVLERNKFKYLFDEIYLKSLKRDPNRGIILLSQLTTKICKF